MNKQDTQAMLKLESLNEVLVTVMKIMGKIAITILFWVLAGTEAGAIVYVDKDAAVGGDGSCWSLAYRTLSEAIAESGAGQEFWVAKGSTAYQPVSPLYPFANSEFYGGFAGNESARNQRNIAGNETIIDGQNSLKHIFVIGTEVDGVRIDGLTIRNGNANDYTGWDQYGGGVLIQDHKLGGLTIIANSTIENCYATTQGGGVDGTRSLIRIEGCLFKNNHSYLGGGFMGWESDVTITNSRFESNTADIGVAPRGGAVWVGGLDWQYHDNKAVITDSTFDQNSSTTNGGAVEFASVDGGEIRGCHFTNNRSTGANAGGGGVSVTEGQTIIADSTIENCYATTQGGGVKASQALVSIEGCLFKNNQSYLGGGFMGWESDVTITTSRFESNTADIAGDDPRGGAVWIGGWDWQCHDNEAVITDSTFDQNSSTSTGGAVEFAFVDNGEIRGCLFTNNSSTGVRGGGGGVTVTASSEYTAPYTLITECTFIGNTSGLEGGAVYSNRNDLDITDCLFVENQGVNGGAVMIDYRHPSDQSVLMDRCRFFGNFAVTGGAIRSYARDAEIINSVFAHNEAEGGGAIGFHGGSGGDYNPCMAPVLKNCSFYGNNATAKYGGALVNSYVDMVFIYNSIFWGNDSNLTIWDPNQCMHVKTPDIFNAASSNVTIHYSDMESLNWNKGSDVSEPDVITASFSQDPLFNNPAGIDGIEGTSDDDLRLTISSPCLDRADADHAPALDMEYKSRIDIGSAANNGAGSPPYIDLGPYELGDKPTVMTRSPFNIDEDTSTGVVSVQFAGVVNPNGSSAVWCFEYGPDKNYGSFTDPACDNPAGSGFLDLPVNKAMHFSTNKLYHYRLIARNGVNPSPEDPSEGNDMVVMTTVFYVEPLGRCGEYGAAFPTRCKSTIQDAIDAAMENSKGGTIKIAGQPNSYGRAVIGKNAMIYLDSNNEDFCGDAAYPVIIWEIRRLRLKGGSL
jgi:predicted outer membrane repeat protein